MDILLRLPRGLAAVAVAVMLVVTARALPATADAGPVAGNGAPGAGAGVGAGAGAGAPGAGAGGVDGAALQSLLDDDDAAAAQEAAAQTQLQGSLAHKKDLDAKVASLDAKIAVVQQALDGAQARLEAATAAVVQQENDLSRLQGQLAAARDVLLRRAVEAYTNPTATGMADYLLRARSLSEVSDTSGFMEAVVRVQENAVKAFAADKKLVEMRQADVDNRRAEARRARDTVADQRATLDGARAEWDTARQAVNAEVATQQQLVAQLAAARAAYEAEIVALTSQSNDLANILRTAQAGQELGAAGHGLLMVPVPGAPITSPYGPRIHPIFGDVRMHTGIDYGAPEGTPIHAAADGTVAMAGPYGGYGNATVIDHGGELATLYGHQSLILVKPGDHVIKGQIIGLVGCTGSCTGPHVHFEVRVGGNPVDPAPFL